MKDRLRNKKEKKGHSRQKEQSHKRPTAGRECGK